MCRSNVIVIAGAAGSGKTTSAKVLANHWYKSSEIVTVYATVEFPSFEKLCHAKCVIVEEVKAEKLRSVFELAKQNSDKRFIILHETS